MIKGEISFPILTLFVATILFSIPPAFAENVSVSVPQGTAVPGCETTNECFLPPQVLITKGDTVTWSNDDSAAHTVTAGTAKDGPSGFFDSSLFMAGTTFSHTFESNGEFAYFCMVHPWMEGLVLVGDTMAKDPKSMPVETPPIGMEMNEKVKITLKHDIVGSKVTNIYADTDSNSLIMELDTTDSGQITVTLPRKTIDAKIGTADDVFFVLVDGEEVSFDETKTAADRTLIIQFPSGAEEIEIIGTFVIPEFGAIAVLILAVAIISIIVVSTKSRLGIIPRL